MPGMKEGMQTARAQTAPLKRYTLHPCQRTIDYEKPAGLLSIAPRRERDKKAGRKRLFVDRHSAGATHVPACDPAPPGQPIASTRLVVVAGRPPAVSACAGTGRLRRAPSRQGGPIRTASALRESGPRPSSCRRCPITPTPTLRSNFSERRLTDRYDARPDILGMPRNGRWRRRVHRDQRAG